MSNRPRSRRSPRTGRHGSPHRAGAHWPFGPPVEPAVRPVSAPPPEEPAVQLARAVRLLELVSVARRSRTPVPAPLRDELAALPQPLVHQAAEAMLLDACAVAWTRGWQPAELARRGRLECANAEAARLVALAIAHDHVARRSVTLHPRWVAQVESLELPPADGAPGWVARWVRATGLAPGRVHPALGDALAAISALRPLAVLLPPPGDPDAPVAPPVADYVGVADGDANDPLLQRIRNLLAKAESTTFEAESVAFTAKAQELMTRHAIDAARVHGPRRAGERPIAIRIPVDAPYAEVKATLLAVVAEASRCRIVLLSDVGLATVLGFPDDVAGVDALFTSLLVQAQRALGEAGARRAATGEHGASATRAFRTSFLQSFTHRIQERLAAINEAVVAAAAGEAGGDAFLPVFASRAEEVAAFVAEQFADLRPLRMRQHYDPAGWSSGRAAGDQARLTRADVGGATTALPSGPG